jgi:hypothetical protein
MPKEPKPHDVDFHEETDSPTYADDRNFYKVEKWTRDWMKVDSLLYAPLERYAEVLEWLWEIHPSVSPDVALAVVSVIPPFPVPGGNDG